MSTINPGDFPIDPQIVDGTELADRLNRYKLAQFSNNASPTRPADVVAGGLWTRTGVAGDPTVMLFTGAADVPISGATGIVFPDLTAQASSAYTKAEGDARFVNTAGDVMTGTLSLRANGGARPLSIKPDTELSNYIEHLRPDGSVLGTIGSGGGAASSTGGAYDYVLRAGPNQLILQAFNLIACANPITPLTDSGYSCGSAGQRWSSVFAVAGTINTSDARKKTPVRPFTANELAAAKALAKEIGLFKWLQTEKGPGVREHCGITVQKVIEIMEANGLDAFNYAFVCYDNTPETSRTLEGGEVIVTPAVDVYSLRMDQLNFFILRGMEERLAALEAA